MIEPSSAPQIATAAHVLDSRPLEKPEKIQHLWSTLEAMDGENALLFASDYPHWDYDAVDRLHIPPQWREKIFGLNALEVYGRLPRLQASAVA